MKVIDKREKRSGVALSEIKIGEAFGRQRTESIYLKINDADRATAFNLNMNCLADIPETELVYQVEAVVTITYPAAEIENKNIAIGGGQGRKAQEDRRRKDQSTARSGVE